MLVSETGGTVDLATYKKRRDLAQLSEPRYRQRCLVCLQPDFSCYCRWLQPFDPQMEFVILSHPLECRRRIATGRMSHLSLKGSRLIRGYDFSRNAEVSAILENPALQCLLLYPGVQSKNLSEMTKEDLHAIKQPNKKLAIFVVDGTWWTARKMVSMSSNLLSLKRICFTPSALSEFHVRRQPRAECYSTIEAIHQTIVLLGSACGFDSKEHHGLLSLFRTMVNQQIALANCGKPNNHRRGR